MTNVLTPNCCSPERHWLSTACCWTKRTMISTRNNKPPGQALHACGVVPRINHYGVLTSRNTDGTPVALHSKLYSATGPIPQLHLRRPRDHIITRATNPISRVDMLSSLGRGRSAHFESWIYNWQVRASLPLIHTSTTHSPWGKKWSATITHNKGKMWVLYYAIKVIQSWMHKSYGKNVKSQLPISVLVSIWLRGEINGAVKFIKTFIRPFGWRVCRCALYSFDQPLIVSLSRP